MVYNVSTLNVIGQILFSQEKRKFKLKPKHEFPSNIRSGIMF